MSLRHAYKPRNIINVDNFDNFAQKLPPVKDDPIGKCRWPTILGQDYFSGKLEGDSPYTLQHHFERKLIAECLRKINPNIPQHAREPIYLAVTGGLGKGKSLLGIGLAYILDHDFTSSDIVMGLDEWTERILKRRENYFLVNDEPQDWLSAYRWQQLWSSGVGRILETQRGKGANFVWCLPNMSELVPFAKRTVQYIIHVRYRCPHHSHGYVWERLDHPTEVAILRVGTFQWDNPFLYGPSDLKRIIQEYLKRKEDYMNKGLENLSEESVEGGRDTRFAQEYINYVKKTGIGAVSEGGLRLWIKVTQKMVTLPKTEIKEIWQMVKYLASTEGLKVDR